MTDFGKEQRVPEHIRKMRQAIDNKQANDPIRKVDRYLSHKKVSSSLTAIYILLAILGVLGGSTIIVIFIY
jgi:hypothetical protein